jgi:hypothetical protein
MLVAFPAGNTILSEVHGWRMTRCSDRARFDSPAGPASRGPSVRDARVLSGRPGQCHNVASTQSDVAIPSQLPIEPRFVVSHTIPSARRASCRSDRLGQRRPAEDGDPPVRRTSSRWGKESREQARPFKWFEGRVSRVQNAAWRGKRGSRGAGRPASPCLSLTYVCH